MLKLRGDTLVPDPLPAHTHAARTHMLAHTHGFSPSRGLRPRLGSKPVPHYACPADPIPAPEPLLRRRSSWQLHTHSLAPPLLASAGQSTTRCKRADCRARRCNANVMQGAPHRPTRHRTSATLVGHGCREAPDPRLVRCAAFPSWEPWRAALLHRGYSKRAAAPCSF